MALDITLVSHGLNTTGTPEFNWTNLTFDYEGEDPRFFDPTEDSNEEYIWDPEDYGSSEPITSITKVFGGRNATRGEIPHQVSLRRVDRRNAHFCGASIIHPFLLLTAAHCITTLNFFPDQIQVIAGEHSLDVAEDGEQVRNVSQIILHDGWNMKTLENDIAILVLNEPLQFYNCARSIGIAKGGEIRPEKVKVSGWGKTSEMDKTAFTEHQVALIRFVQWHHCRRFYAERGKNITESMLCAGGKKRDACEGDSGGPLTCQQIQSNETYLCGIVSWGVNRCGSHGWPGVYTDVSKYYTWIRKYMRIWDRRLPSPGADGERLSILISDTVPSDLRPVHMNASQAQASRRGEFPHHVSLRRAADPKRHFCSASIIHPLLLLTTAQCLLYWSAKDILAVTGDYHMGSLEGTEQIRNIRQVIVHENWNALRGDNDIAILVLGDPLRFDNYTRIISIPRGNISRQKNALLSSWDVRDPTQGSSGVLVGTPFHLRGPKFCRSTFSKFKMNVTDNMLCARSKIGNYCGGDLGDPLKCKEQRGNGYRYTYLCGMVSWGVRSSSTCGHFPLVFTDVLRYQDWIHKHMQTIWQQYQVSILGGDVGSREDCGESKFRCPNSGICIPEDFRCDGEYDCDPFNDWDERNCKAPERESSAAVLVASETTKAPLRSAAPFNRR